MLEVRFHGRAGQGIVTSAELLAEATAMQGKFSQAFPFFGSEKRGPPVTSYCRIDNKPVKIHEEIIAPDIVVVTEPSILEEIKVDDGLKPNGTMLVNYSRPKETLKLKAKHLFVFNGTEIAVKHFQKPITNTVMLGALCKITGITKLENIELALKNKFPEKIAQLNIDVIRESYNAVSDQLKMSVSSHY